MKISQKYVLSSMATMLTVAGMTLGVFSFAQTVTPLTCSVGMPSINANQAVTLTASGGNGTYAWSGTNLNVTNSAGSQFAVSYPTPGTYNVMVSSAGQTATCAVNVTGTATTGTLMCAPAVQNVTIGQTASVAATGGNGTYSWASPDLTITNPSGSGFSANYASTGLKTLTVSSNGQTATCAVNVLPSSSVVTPPVVTPGLPNTGGGYGK